MIKIHAFLEWNLYTLGVKGETINRKYSTHKIHQIVINAGENIKEIKRVTMFDG